MVALALALRLEQTRRGGAEALEQMRRCDAVALERAQEEVAATLAALRKVARGDRDSPVRGFSSCHRKVGTDGPLRMRADPHSPRPGSSLRPPHHQEGGSP
ncbi:hypothetical protein ACQPZX_20065 [Actinoplanes sp. CA-142083]|uniref:hypothetical protein n=1 Tax=Actinoplanes sp. CA-142083 TaxID=3239903 RepID=UPI003D8A62EE